MPAWTINPPTTNADLAAQVKLPTEPTPKNYTDPQYSIAHTKYWIPDLSNTSAGYSTAGLEASRQTWIAPWWVNGLNSSTLVSSDTPLAGPSRIALPYAIRQLVSWNRERYAYQNQFWDLDRINNSNPKLPTNLYKPLVVTNIELTPRPDIMDSYSEGKSLSTQLSTLLGTMAFSSDTDYTYDGNNYTYNDLVKFVQEQLKAKKLDGTEPPDFKPYQQVFPRIRSQFWQVNLSWQPDPYVNRFGIRYAKIEMSPSLRLESLKNISMGIVPTDINGQPDFNAVDADYVYPDTNPEVNGNPELIERITTGFPVREPQVTVRITYPWVSLPDLLAAGPIGNPNQLTADETAVVSPQVLPIGQYLGCVNKSSFLGFSRGRVLYNAAELEETTSPITGKIGYRVTHEFIINTNMEWNQTRYTGLYDPDPTNVVQLGGTIPGINQFQTDLTVPYWKTGFMVQMASTTGGEKVYRVDMGVPANPALRYQAQYPYPYKDHEDLLYYGYVGQTTKFDPQNTLEG